MNKTRRGTAKALAEPSTTAILRVDEYCAALRKSEDVRTFYKTKANCAPIVAAIRELAVEKKVRVISYDVFDTVLLRECKSEAGRFWDISERFVAHCQKEGKEPGFAAEDAFLARVKAAGAAYSISPTLSSNREGKFEDIARIACDLLGRPDLTSAYIANELDYEVGALVANPLVQLLAAALPQTKIIFISDMYLEGEKIAHLLIQKLGSKYSGRVFSSADGYGSKRTGGIFSHVETALGQSGEKLLHIGDSLHSDFQMPKRRGWNSFHLPLPEPEKDARRGCHDAVKTRFAAMGVPFEKYLQFNM